MKILIAGSGKVGATLAGQLAAEGFEITLIDSNPKILESTVEMCDVMVFEGNAASMSMLRHAGVKDADLLIATTGADEVNLLCCATAHGMNPKLHAIARIRNPEYMDQAYALRDAFGLSLTINPERQAAQEMARLLQFPGFLKRESFARGRIEIVELKISADSKLCNVPLNELQGIVKCRVLVCLVLRDGRAIAPDGSFVLHENDRIFVTAPTNALAELLKNLGIITRRAETVLVAGGGRVSYYLAGQLEKSGIHVRIIEKDFERCRHLATMMPNLDIVHGDASSKSLLESEGLRRVGALVTATGMDELNMMISLYGVNLGVPQIITKISHVYSDDIIHSLPIQSVICPTTLCANQILRYVRAMKNQTGAALSVHSIADGHAEATEFIADEKTLNCGKPLREIRLRKNVLIASISHGGRIDIPNGDSTFRSGDYIIVVTSSGTPVYQLNDIFE